MPTGNPLFRLLAVNLAGGTVAAIIAVVGLVGLDCFGLGRLLLHDQDPALALVLLTFGFVVTFGSAAMGSAIMMSGGGADGRPDHGGRRAQSPWRPNTCHASFSQQRSSWQS